MTRDETSVLFANEAFYVAFETRDLAAMEALWSEHQAMACVHPGWGPISGRDAVMESWRGILSHPENPKVTCRLATPHVLGDAAFVTCFEVIDGKYLAATNVFRRENGGWKMVHHQAGASAVAPPDSEQDDEKTTMQ